MIAKPTTKEPELHPDAWERLERAVSVVAKSPPQHGVMGEKSLAKRSGAKKPRPGRKS
jgi:hypothetical protein